MKIEAVLFDMDGLMAVSYTHLEYFEETELIAVVRSVFIWLLLCVVALGLSLIHIFNIYYFIRLQKITTISHNPFRIKLN